ncbi:hypothetical protein QWY75_06630 [Pontixanthobacter aestiaquae]|uniref:UDP-N-acetyl-alpha-D-muramoyl-L-alanyl-L-glutamate epimerase n=1 Tax=Pontixanthobacter aestiaquae TaxID=1509367 RepID=A0A844ZBA7_9SPHN|nr:hypothetical protein [Pontixanthobacter aestiaquae]MDN3645877.1 hypothetical protein [Pontixanthobacter aestiaquae]MXO83129.1 hypothetical protein [Pontixanthobacter aestiaquae]
MATPRTLRLAKIRWTHSQLFFEYTLDGLTFTNAIWYEGVDFDGLSERFGAAFIRAMIFHIAAFEMNKIVSLKPDTLDWGDYSDLVTAEFKEIWLTIYRNVWAQWRFENDEPDYLGPDFAITATDAPPAIGERDLSGGFLSFCGGGKDSLVSLDLLKSLGQEHGTLAYSASFYGRAAPQHALIGKLLDSYGVTNQHRQWIYDDFLDSPVLELRKDLNVDAVTAAETPSSIFGALPYVLHHNYRYVCLAHERSADAPQVVWEKTGEPVNHQWGKSYEAEKLLNDYVRAHLVSEFDYFSILKPIYDVSIFGALRGVTESIPHTHSCNIEKPWCRRCAKCLYVWLGYTAFLDREIVEATFGPENLYDVPENTFLFRQLVGLESQLPFECIGEAQEAALFMLMARTKGYRGQALDACSDALDKVDVANTLDRYLDVVTGDANIPETIKDRLEQTLLAKAADTRKFVEELLS